MEDGEKVVYEKLVACNRRQTIRSKDGRLKKKTAYSHSQPLQMPSVLQQKLTAYNAKSAVVIGAGLIGISVTEALVKRGLKVTMVELQEKILSLLLDAKASDIVEAVVRKAGVNFATGQSVQKILANQKTTVQLAE